MFYQSYSNILVKLDNLPFLSQMTYERVVYRKSLKETRGSHSFFEAWNAGLIQGRVSFEGGSYL